MILEHLILVRSVMYTLLCPKGLAVMITQLVSLTTDVQWGQFHLAV